MSITQHSRNDTLNEDIATSTEQKQKRKNLLFTGNALTEEAKKACYLLNFEPQEILPRGIDSFREKDIPDRVLELRYGHFQMKRKAKIQMIRKLLNRNLVRGVNLEDNSSNSARFQRESFPIRNSHDNIHRGHFANKTHTGPMNQDLADPIYDATMMKIRTKKELHTQRYELARLNKTQIIKDFEREQKSKYDVKEIKLNAISSSPNKLMMEKLNKMKSERTQFEQKRQRILDDQSVEQEKRIKLSNEYEQRNFNFIQQKKSKAKEKLEDVFAFYRGRELNYIQRKEDEIVEKKKVDKEIEHELSKYQERMNTNESRSKSANLQTQMKARQHCQKALNRFILIKSQKQEKDLIDQHNGLSKLHMDYIRNLEKNKKDYNDLRMQKEERERKEEEVRKRLKELDSTWEGKRNEYRHKLNCQLYGTQYLQKSFRDDNLEKKEIMHLKKLDQEENLNREKKAYKAYQRDLIGKLRVKNEKGNRAIALKNVGSFILNREYEPYKSKES